MTGINRVAKGDALVRVVDGFLKAEGYKTHVARKVRIRVKGRYINVGEDIWGAFDILATRVDRMRHVQVTTYPNDSVRRKVIDALPLPPPDPRLRYEVWAWHDGPRWGWVIYVKGIQPPISDGHGWSRFGLLSRNRSQIVSAMYANAPTAHIDGEPLSGSLSMTEVAAR